MKERYLKRIFTKLLHPLGNLRSLQIERDALTKLNVSQIESLIYYLPENERKPYRKNLKNELRRLNLSKLKNNGTYPNNPDPKHTARRLMGAIADYSLEVKRTIRKNLIRRL
ncbi:MAG: hypothetical protein ABIB79_02115 [archaeon]